MASSLDTSFRFYSTGIQEVEKNESQAKLNRIYRIKLFKNCKLFYTIDEDKKEIYIAHVFHNLQNGEDML